MSDNGKFLKIKAFAFDVDGVLTDGGILADLNGELYRVFDSKDSMAIRMAVMKGFHMAIITGGRSESIRKRFETCGIQADDVYLSSRAKIEDFQDFCNRHKLAPEEVMYFGDDLPDIPVMQACGCGVCPNDAVDEVKAIADHVSTKPGGKGCAREILQAVMQAQGIWHLDVYEYKRHF
jgi:3-deoxy-D-manno-octulosonate 8-phosphate phosphatase (KDO 8-P phosphatase)